MRPGACNNLRVLASVVLALSASTVFAQTAPWGNWTTVQVSTNSFGLRCVAHANGRFVAYGDQSDWGYLMSSEDGMNWTLRLDGRPSNSLSWAVGLVYTGSKFFALGGFGVSAVSTNGIDWTSIQTGAGYDLGLVYARSRYVAVGGPSGGSDQNVYTSADGISWAPQHSTSPPNVALGDIAYGAGLFVAVGASHTDESGHIYSSFNGTNWTRANLPIPGGPTMVFYKGLFVLAGGIGRNLLSQDGLNWFVVNTGLTNAIYKITSANNVLLARSGDYLSASTDGTNWIQYPDAIPQIGGRSRYIATDGIRLVTVGAMFAGPLEYNGYIYYSEPMIAVQMTGRSPPQISLSGLVGRSYRIESTDALTGSGAGSWQTRTNFQLSTPSFVWTDPTAASSGQRFYRGVLLP